MIDKFSDGPKVSDFIDLKIWKKKKVCCGTIFVNAFGEAIVDPRFLNSHHNNTENIQEAIGNPLMSFENIVKKELEEVQSAQNTGTLVTDSHNFKVPDRKERKDSEKSCDSKFSSDQDEGFFDRTSSSPCFEESNSQSSTSSSSSTSMSSLTLSKI